MKQTAVDWLVQQLSLREDISLYAKEIRIAKQIEKEQLNIARLDGINLANKGYKNKQ